MYWTHWTRGDISKGGTDGSNGKVILTGLVQPCGIQYDYTSNRLYWAEEDGKKIQSSSSQGTNVRMHVKTSGRPYSMAVLNGRLYWGHYFSRPVESSTVAGQDIRTVYTAPSDVRQFHVPKWTRAASRMNHCELNNCSKVCILTPTTARCLSG